MVVVGGRNSANTKELTRLCQIAGTPAIQIESARDLDDPAAFAGARVVGVTGGTSTPIEDLGTSPSACSSWPGPTPTRVARAARLAGERADAARAKPAGRTTSLRSARTAVARRRGLSAAPMPARSAGLPVVAFVGRPNVGKSTLFNRVVGERAAIVEDRARTTRDRLYGDAEWNGRRFVVVDTGGLEAPRATRSRPRSRSRHGWRSAEADVIVFLVDAAAGLTPADQEARRAPAAHDGAGASSPPTRPTTRSASSRPPSSTRSAGRRHIAIARLHGRGVADLLDVVVWALPPESRGRARAQGARGRGGGVGEARWPQGRLDPNVVGDGATLTTATRTLEGADDDAETEREAPHAGTRSWPPTDDEPAAIAIVGRPNVGKSSLLNALLGEERAICRDIPGTTRDAIDTRVAWGRSEVVLIDTAGIRRRGKVASGPAAERYSTLRALKAISRADVAVLVLDAVDGLTAQDAHVAGYVVEEGRGLVVAVNKWDLVEDKTDRTFDEYVDGSGARRRSSTSRRSSRSAPRPGSGSSRVLELAVDIGGERRQRIPTGELNRLVSAAVERQPPPIVHGRRPKLFYATQVAVEPPTFVFFATRRRVDPLQLPALPREPAARRVRLRRHADPPRLPRRRIAREAARRRGKAGRRGRRRGRGRRWRAGGRAAARAGERARSGPGRRRRRRGVGHDARRASSPSGSR